MMDESQIKRRSASFGSTLSYRPPTPPRNRNGQGSNLRRSERIHLVETTDSDTPTQACKNIDEESISSSDGNERHPALVSSATPRNESSIVNVPCSKATQVDNAVVIENNSNNSKSNFVPKDNCPSIRPVSGQDRVRGGQHESQSLPSSSADYTETSDTSMSLRLSSPVSSSTYHYPGQHPIENESFVWKRPPHSQNVDYYQQRQNFHNRRPMVTQSYMFIEDPHHHGRMMPVDGFSPLPSDCSCGSYARNDTSRVRRRIRNNCCEGILPGCYSDSSTSSVNTESHRRRVKSSRSERNTYHRSKVLTPDYVSDRYCRHGRNSRCSPRRVSPLHIEDPGSIQKIQLQQLESDKQNLLLQVSVLNEQIEAQKDKIKELEDAINGKSNQIKELKRNLHEERMAKSTVENNKLELLTEISSLRQKLTIADRERRESEERCRRIEGELEIFAERVGCTDGEHSNNRKARGNSTLPYEKGSEIEKLKRALDTVIASNEEKDTRIETLYMALTKYKKIQEYVLLGHQRKSADGIKDVSSLETTDANLESRTLPSPVLDFHKSHNSMKSNAKAASMSRSTCPGTSSASHCEADFIKNYNAVINKEQHQQSSCPSPTMNRSNSLENIRSSASKFTLPKSSYGTVPRQNGPQVLQQLQEQLQNYENKSANVNIDMSDGIPMAHRKPVEEVITSPRLKSTGVSFGKGFFKLKSGKRSSSAPELAPFESITIPSIERDYASASPTPQPTMQPFLKPDRSKGLKKFFTRWKRSGSQNIDKFEGEFRRGGIRSTAGPRLGWTHDISADPDIPFPRWTNDFVVDWMNKIGLTMYISEIKRWRCNGEQLLNSSLQDIEKHLNMKNLMHKKKLQLALQGVKCETLPSSINSMDYLWVIRWLDDVGLPQYKDSFSESRVDGRVLHYLTVDDLLNLKVTNQLHHVSIKRGIQLLREKNFDPHCLIRRSLPDEDKNYKPESVALWTNHRVMEWLRTVDLSEYAPNLRGSGVHGALIVYEPKFNTDLFASLLNIPPPKTLLRRHLATHFKNIIGADLAQAKRDLETDQLYTPLTPNIKIKGIRKPQFSLKKKKGKMEGDVDEFVCPMDIPVGSEIIKPDGDKLVVRRNSDPAPQEKALDVDDEKAVEEIGAVSKEITSLTSLLQEEKLLKNAPTTNV